MKKENKKLHKKVFCTGRSRKPLLTGLLFLLAGFFCLQVSAQSRTISGTVVDDSGEPVIGANVQVKGMSVGSITDVDGRFAFEAPQSGTLVISYIGYKAQEVALGKTTYNLVLHEDTEALGEIVVIGYGTQRKSDVTGSIASVNADDIRAVPGSNITQSLQGRVAGVEMMQTSSKPGSEMQVRIRGTRSLTASNDPLLVLTASLLRAPWEILIRISSRV